MPDDIWNMDETGFRIGVGKDQLIVTKRRRAHYFGIPENRESATAIEAISAGGEYIPAFLILAGQMHMAPWYQIPGLDEDMVIRPTPTGYSNDEISLEWLAHFDKHSAKTSKGVKRLLIIDGHGSHHTKQFIQYCDDHNIIPFGMPPNLTHLLQPLDVVVFQPFNPRPVLQILEARQAEKTPTPPSSPGGPHSSPFVTPVTLRQMNKVASKLETELQGSEELDPEFTYDLDRFIRGSLSLATELIQTKRDLGRTKMAELAARQRRAMKNTPLQSGGVLTVAQGREMVLQREEDQVAKARKVVEAAELKARNARKRCFEEAAKEARKWRISGKLKRVRVCDSERGTRMLVRF